MKNNDNRVTLKLTKKGNKSKRNKRSFQKPTNNNENSLDFSNKTEDMKLYDITKTLKNTKIQDLLLNKTLDSLDNKNFKNMYYISYKILFGFIEELKNNGVNIDDKLLENYISNKFNDIMQKFTNNLKKRNRKTLQNDLRCMGRKIDGKQCTRRKKDGSEYCQSHYKKLTNGRIDEEYQAPKKKNKRGRKRKVEFDPRAYDEEYITTWEDIINDEKVLIDVNNNVFTFDLTNPKFLGKKSLDGTLIKVNT